jgi:hypothetical protein
MPSMCKAHYRCTNRTIGVDSRILPIAPSRSILESVSLVFVPGIVCDLSRSIGVAVESMDWDSRGNQHKYDPTSTGCVTRARVAAGVFLFGRHYLGHVLNKAWTREG